MLLSMYESSEVLPALCGRCKKVPDELLRAIQKCKRDDQSVIGVLVQIQTVHQFRGSVCYEHQKKIGVVRDISPLICPSAQVLRIYGAKHLKHLMESVNEGWNSSVAFCGPRPQPDYSGGFARSAITIEQLEKRERQACKLNGLMHIH